jgi:hypothetical protein
MNQILDDFTNVDVSGLKMPIISVFFDTIDIPKKYVARLFDLDKPTDIVVIKDTLEELRSIIPSELTRIERHQNDHPTVVEIWL